MKWLVALLITVFIAGVCLPRLAARMRLGRLPGDLRLRFKGREYFFPFASTLLFSFLAMLLMHFL